MTLLFLSFQLYQMFPNILYYLPGPHNQVFAEFDALKAFVAEEVKVHQASLDPNSPQDFIDCFLSKMEEVRGHLTVLAHSQTCELKLSYAEPLPSPKKQRCGDDPFPRGWAVQWEDTNCTLDIVLLEPISSGCAHSPATTHSYLNSKTFICSHQNTATFAVWSWQFLHWKTVGTARTNRQLHASWCTA